MKHSSVISCWKQVTKSIWQKKGDFIVDSQYTFEVGGGSKTFKQIRDVKDSYLAVDNTPIEDVNRIPLWVLVLNQSPDYKRTKHTNCRKDLRIYYFFGTTFGTRKLFSKNTTSGK